MTIITERERTMVLVDHHVANLRRLAAEAREKGCLLYRDDLGNWLCSSRRDPSRLHQLTTVSCTCLGFIHTQRCGHLGMVLQELGFIPGPDDPQPDPPANRAPGPMSSRSTMPAFDAIEAVLCGPARADDAFYLESILRTPSPACDEWPDHETLLESYGLECDVETFLAWCDWCNEQDMISDYADMAVAA